MPRRKIAALAASLLLLAATGAAAAAIPKPTSTAITYWKKTVLKPANLPNWWDGYLKNAHLAGCKWMTTKGIRFYDCRVETRIDNTVLAFASLVRYSRCGYATTLASTHGNRQFTRRFKLCPG